ncbi:hypothetical protein [Marinospirillum alkaliphilum]|uniref:Leucine rich repeat variant n=1 Tax=Marinospirillum alkaliphilum DSM 21637 TaxID=1122209 RepID=A0A1K1TW02_9GAMM|nr:hypothetical protein [Marinospirillum alkaliphilum]SFX04895.1 hypothetical protein SAMN02745752_00342 [Marinospirillum alkaliphilum DSM 21637]
MIDTQQLKTLLQSKEHLEQQLVLSLSARPETWRSIHARHPELAFVLAQNPSLPTDLADELAAHPDSRVRLMIARRGKPGYIALLQLSQDPEAAVRLAVAKRDDLDNALIEQLQQDSDLAVSLAAQLYQQQPLAMASGW